MLVGPRTRDGALGYHVITPIERDNGYHHDLNVQELMSRPPVLVNRGWVSQIFALRETRPASIDPATTIIKGLSTFSQKRDQ